MVAPNYPHDKYVVIFRDQAQKSAWNVTSNYDTPQQALDAQKAFRENVKTEAYAVNLRVLIEHVPDFVLSQVELAERAGQ